MTPMPNLHRPHSRIDPAHYVARTLHVRAGVACHLPPQPPPTSPCPSPPQRTSWPQALSRDFSPGAHASGHPRKKERKVKNVKTNLTHKTSKHPIPITKMLTNALALPHSKPPPRPILQRTRAPRPYTLGAQPKNPPRIRLRLQPSILRPPRRECRGPTGHLSTASPGTSNDPAQGAIESPS
jgi:hypothetical protein